MKIERKKVNKTECRQDPAAQKMLTIKKSPGVEPGLLKFDERLQS